MKTTQLFAFGLLCFALIAILQATSNSPVVQIMKSLKSLKPTSYNEPIFSFIETQLKQVQNFDDFRAENLATYNQILTLLYSIRDDLYSQKEIEEKRHRAFKDQCYSEQDSLNIQLSHFRAEESQLEVKIPLQQAELDSLNAQLAALQQLFSDTKQANDDQIVSLQNQYDDYYNNKYLVRYAYLDDILALLVKAKGMSDALITNNAASLIETSTSIQSQMRSFKASLVQIQSAVKQHMQKQKVQQSLASKAIVLLLDETMKYIDQGKITRVSVLIQQLIDSFSGQQANLKQEQADKYAALLAQIAALNQQVTDLANQLQDLQARIVTAQNDLLSAEDQLKTVINQISILEGELRVSMDRCNAEMDGFNRIINHLQNEILAIQELIDLFEGNRNLFDNPEANWIKLSPPTVLSGSRDCHSGVWTNDQPNYFQVDDLAGAKNYGVFGWFFMSTKYPKPFDYSQAWTTMFRLRENDQFWSDAGQAGDRSLAMWLNTQGNMFAFHFTSYNTNTFDNNQYTFSQQFSPSDIEDKWTFVYMAYSGDKHTVATYVKTAGGSFIQEWVNVYHSDALPKAQIIVGRDYFYSGWNGNIQAAAFRDQYYNTEDQIQSAFLNRYAPSDPNFDGCANYDDCNNASIDFKTVYLPVRFTSQDQLVGALQADPTSGYCQSKRTDWVQVSNQNACQNGANSNQGWQINIKFHVQKLATYNFRFGTDFGYGGWTQLDGVQKTFANVDMWWAGNYNNAPQLNFGQSITPGDHILQVFGGEGCCGGAMTFQFQVNEGSWNDMTVNNLAGQCKNQ